MLVLMNNDKTTIKLVKDQIEKYTLGMWLWWTSKHELKVASKWLNTHLLESDLWQISSEKWKAPPTQMPISHFYSQKTPQDHIFTNTHKTKTGKNQIFISSHYNTSLKKLLIIRKKNQPCSCWGELKQSIIKKGPGIHVQPTRRTARCTKTPAIFN